MNNQQVLIEKLEALVDANGLASVVIALHLACIEKAEHLRCNWQDEINAEAYDRAAKVLYIASKAPAIEAVS